MNRATGEYDEAAARDRLAHHVLIQASHGRAETWWLVTPDGCWQESACVTFVGTDAVIITGDLLFGKNRAIAAIGYDRRWFVDSQRDGHYLCAKFLREEWQPLVAERTGKTRTLRLRRKRDITKAEARILWTACTEDADEPVEFGAAWASVFGDWPDFGSAFTPVHAENLIAVQHRFCQLWNELYPTIDA